MVSEETRKKIWIFALIGGVVLGFLFVIWAVFLNRGSIVVSAQVPFQVSIPQFKTVECQANPCRVEVAPQNYRVTVSKPGFHDVVQAVRVPWNGEVKLDVTLPFIAVLKKVDAGAMPSAPTSQYKAYLARNEQNFRQTLYLQEMITGGLWSKPVAVTSFVRNVTQEVIQVAPNGKKIVVVDQSDPAESKLYLVDIEQKTRENILNYAFIRDVQWLEDSQHFLVEGRPTGSLVNSIFYYKPEATAGQQLVDLGLQTTLANVALSEKGHLIIATTQEIAGLDGGDQLDGKIINLDSGRAGAALQPGETPPTPVLAFLDYSLTNLEARLIKQVSGQALPGRVQLSEDKKSLFAQMGKEVWELRFEP